MARIKIVAQLSNNCLLLSLIVIILSSQINIIHLSATNQSTTKSTPTIITNASTSPVTTAPTSPSSTIKTNLSLSTSDPNQSTTISPKPIVTTTSSPTTTINLNEIKKNIHQHVDRNHGENILALNKPTLAPQIMDFPQGSMEVRVADATSQFGLRFIQNSLTETKENVVISPLSLQNLLNMVLLATGDDSATQAELIKVLGYDDATFFQKLNQSISSGSEKRLKPHESMKSVLQSIQSATHFTQESNSLLNTNLGAISNQQVANEDKSLSSGSVAAHLQTNQNEEDTQLSQQINFTLANLVITNEDKIKLNPDYEKELKKFYDVEMETFSKDNKSKSSPQLPLHERINTWVNNMTQGQIDKLVSESELDVNELLMVLLNAAHFKGRWLHTFNSQATYENLFFNNGQEKDAPTVKFMRQKGTFGYADFGSVSMQNEMWPDSLKTRSSEDFETLLTEDAATKGSDNVTTSAKASHQLPSIELSKEETRRLELTNKLNCSVLMLPFSLNEGLELSMIILLPAKRDGVAELQASLDVPTLNEIYRSLSEQQVQVELPKFTFEASYDAKEILVKMGLNSMFSNSANLTRMFAPGSAGVQGAKVDKVIHKAKITVDESGAEAAAASMVAVVLRHFIRPPAPTFIADHPFLFIIRHNRSNMPLFMGRVSSL